MLSIKEVARLTGLSTATVSRALDPRYAEKCVLKRGKKFWLSAIQAITVRGLQDALL